jgi:hypothetical protein
MNIIKGLIIDTPHIDNILSGQKTWEMRSTQTKQRGLVALIRKGSGTVVGLAEIIDSIGPFTKSDMLANMSKHMISTTRLDDPKVSKWNNAWVMKAARLLRRPVRYEHPNGAVIWVNLDIATCNAVVAAS